MSRFKTKKPIKWLFELLESGRRDLNPRPSPWQGDVLPLNYSRIEKSKIKYQKSKCFLCAAEWNRTTETSSFSEKRSTTELPRQNIYLYHKNNQNIKSIGWARPDSNRRPSRCKRDALTS